MKVWKYGDNINTDMLFPGKYTYTCSTAEEIIPHLLEDLDSSFAKNVKHGDVIFAGKNFVNEMDKAAKNCKHTVPVLSEDYLRSGFTKAEWYAAFAKDPIGEKRLIISIRIKPCDIEGLLGPIIYIDLVGLNEKATKKKLLEGVKETRLKPKKAPPFRGFGTET